VDPLATTATTTCSVLITVEKTQLLTIIN
jgi:hypothetical protein